LIIAHGYTTLRPGDNLTIFASDQEAKEALAFITREKVEEETKEGEEGVSG